MPTEKIAPGLAATAMFRSIRGSAGNAVRAIVLLVVVVYLLAGAAYELAPRVFGPHCELTLDTKIVQHHEGVVEPLLHWLAWPSAIGADIREARARGVSLSQVRWDRTCPKRDLADAPSLSSRP